MAIAITARGAAAERAGTAATGAAIGAGALAGLIGGLAMGMVAMIRGAAVGPGFFAPLKLIAATFYGADAVQGGAGVIVVGLLLHMATAAVLGVVFGLVVGRRWRIGSALGLGLVWGVVVWVVMTWLVLPMANVTMQDSVMQTPVWWFVYHLIFGAVLVLTPILAAAFSGRPQGPVARTQQRPPEAE